MSRQPITVFGVRESDVGARRFSLALRYYVVLSLVLLTLCVLAAASARFARSTSAQSTLIESKGALLARLDNPVLVLVEKHRSMIDAAARDRGTADRERVRDGADEAEARLRLALDSILGQDAVDAGRQADLRSRLPRLFEAARAVIDQPDEDARREAAVVYDRAADELDASLAGWRDVLQRIIDNETRQLRADAGLLVGWTWAGGLATLLICGLSAFITTRVLRRLAQVTEAMALLAAGRVDVALPKDGGMDELDDLCRAAGAWKESGRRAQLQGEALQHTVTLFDGALNNMRDGLTMFDPKGRIEVINRRVYEFYDLDPAVVGPGSTLRALIEHGIERGVFPGRSAAEVMAEMSCIDAAGPPGSTVVTAAGRTVTLAREQAPDGAWIVTHEDVTDRRRSEEHVRFLERHDVLTGLPNRVELGARLVAAFGEQTAGRPAAGFALHLLDVRRIKQVNEAFGHATGDGLLQLLAGRLRGAVRDGGFLARMEGDRFAVLQSGGGAEEAAGLARRMRRVASEPFRIAAHDVVVGLSVGIALAPSDGESAGTLLRNANLALVRAKAEAAGAWHFFEPGMNAAAQARRELESDLRLALQRGEFEVWYQPLVNTRTRQVSGFEALVRWMHPVRGIVGPVEFIPVAEETGLIVQLGAWVLRTACVEAAGWPPDLKLAVNLSSVQFRDPDLVRTVIQALDDAEFAASRLDLEITESVLLQDSDATLATLHELRALGVRISMDDFGTGYSSLSYLRSFPFDKIKIDKSFVTDLSDRADSLAIVRAVTGIGRSLGMATTAEGVETADQLARLSSEGCTEVQGYLFSPPRPARELPALLRRLAGADALVD
jgi:diguanylate cyclase (GGDEF)-like protein